MKVGVNGAVRDISDLKVGANGAVRAVSEAYIGVNGAVKKVWPTFPVGTVIVLDTVGSGSWECPASGSWNLEIHGGGGGGGYSFANYMGGFTGGGGGGSGSQTTVNLIKGGKYDYTIGAGGQPGNDGQRTSFSSLFSVSGGGGGYYGDPPYSGGNGGGASGELATAGGDGRAFPEFPIPGGVGGYGNKNKPSQSYGNGGNGATLNSELYSQVAGSPGNNGAIILTYLG